MQGSKWPEATAIIAMAAAMAFIFTPWERVGPINWEAISAIGTLLAVVVALAVPLWQNLDRQREQNATAVIRDWALAHTAYQIASQTHGLLVDWSASNRPSSSEFAALLVRATALQDRVESVHGTTIVTELASIASALEGVAKKAEQGALIRATRGAAQGMAVRLLPDLTETQFSDYLKRSESLKRQCENWISRVLADGDRKKVKIPGIVRGSGTADFAISAEGNGRVDRGN